MTDEQKHNYWVNNFCRIRNDYNGLMTHMMRLGHRVNVQKMAQLQIIESNMACLEQMAAIYYELGYNKFDEGFEDE